MKRPIRLLSLPFHELTHGSAVLLSDLVSIFTIWFEPTRGNLIANGPADDEPVTAVRFYSANESHSGATWYDQGRSYPGRH
ncbi:hypothetical protein ACVWZ4_001049 [Bradyrhizobium sp. USDA 4472]